MLADAVTGADAERHEGVLHLLRGVIPSIRVESKK